MKRIIIIAGCFVGMTIAGSLTAQDITNNIPGGISSQDLQGTTTVTNNGNGVTGATGSKGKSSKSKSKKTKSTKPVSKSNTNNYVKPTPNGNGGTHVDDVNPQ